MVLPLVVGVEGQPVNLSYPLYVLSYGPCHYHFRLTNHGQRLHQMYWATGDNISGRTFLPSINTSRKGQVPGRENLVSSTRERPVFSLSPSRVELFPGCSVDMVLTGSSDSPKVRQPCTHLHLHVWVRCGQRQIN